MKFTSFKWLNESAVTKKGDEIAIDAPSVVDKNLITASSTGALLWAKHIIEHLDVFHSNTLEAWYNYFSTGEPAHFFAVMQSLSGEDDN